MLTITPKSQPSLQTLKGSSKSIKFQARDNSFKVIDLDGASGTFEVFLDRRGLDDSAKITKNISIIAANRGEFEVNLSSSDTNVETNVYYYIITINGQKFGQGVFDVVGDDDSRIMQIKRTKGLAFEYFLMSQALNYSRNEIKQNVFLESKKEITRKSNEILIDDLIADANFDESVDELDIEVIQYQDKSPYQVQNLNSNIVQFIPNHPNGRSIIILDDEYPQDTFKLEVNYYSIEANITKSKPRIRELEEDYVMLYLIDNVEANKLQRGITDKTLLGESIRFDQASLENYRKRLDMKIQKNTMKLRPFMTGSVLIPKTYGGIRR